MFNPFVYLKGIFINPQKTFSDFSADRKINSYIVLFFLPQLLINFFPRSLRSEVYTGNMTFASEIQSFVNLLFSIPEFMIFLVAFFISPLISHLFSRRYSKKGNYLQLLACFSLTGSIIIPLSYFVKIFNFDSFLRQITDGLINIWAIYLQVVAVSVVYKLTLRKSILVIIQSLIILILLFLISMFSYAFWSYKNNPNIKSSRQAGYLTSDKNGQHNYLNEDLKFSLSYPSGWMLFNINSDKTDELFDTILLSGQDGDISIYWQKSSLNNLCPSEEIKDNKRINCGVLRLKRPGDYYFFYKTRINNPTKEKEELFSQILQSFKDYP